MRAFLNSLLKTLARLLATSRPLLMDRILKFAWFGKFCVWRAAHPCEVSNWRPAIYHDVAASANLGGEPICYLEFGTHEGRSMRWWLDINRHDGSRFYGFDTFTGLPQSWEAFPAGHFDVSGQLPNISDPRCMFVKGLFQDTVISFLRTQQLEHRRVFHLDADLYGSTICVLCAIAPLLRRGDLLIFDEFHVWMDEFRAFSNFLESFPLRYSALRRSPDWSQVVLMIESDAPEFKR